MAQFHHVTSFEELIKLTSEVGGAHPIIVFVSGAKDAAGKSWCPDCVKGEFIVSIYCRWIRIKIGTTCIIVRICTVYTQ